MLDHLGEARRRRASAPRSRRSGAGQRAHARRRWPRHQRTVHRRGVRGVRPALAATPTCASTARDPLRVRARARRRFRASSSVPAKPSALTETPASSPARAARRASTAQSPAGCTAAPLWCRRRPAPSLYTWRRGAAPASAPESAPGRAGARAVQEAQRRRASQRTVEVRVFQREIEGRRIGAGDQRRHQLEVAGALAGPGERARV